MKKLGLTLLLMTSTVAFSQEVLECTLKINDNKTSRAAKELRTSETKVQVELTEGLEHEQTIQIQRVIAFPGEKKADKFHIRLFSDDLREDNVSKDKEIPMVRMSHSENILMTVTHSGRDTQVKFKSNINRYTLNMSGEGTSNRHNYYLQTRYEYLKKGKAKTAIAPVLITCQRVAAEIINETEIHKGEFGALDEERQIHNKSKNKAIQN